jgi:hypothetical protein
MTGLEFLQLQNNHLVDLPDGFGALKRLRFLYLEGNPLSSEIEAAYKQGPGALRNWLQRRQKRGREIVYKGKLVFIGEGNVGKSRLLAALRGDQWLDKGEAGTTHGIQIKPLKLLDAASGTTAECNCWDFGGQAVYRPTHQLFFSRPAIISGYRRYGATLTAPRKIVTRGRFMACFCNSWSNLTSPIAC